MKKTVALLTILALLSLSLLTIPAFAQYAELIGKEVELKTFQGENAIYVGTDEKMFNLLTGNMMGNNKEGYLTTMLRHKGFEVENHTRARILAIDFWQKGAKVEILDGPSQGYVGWVLLTHAIGY
jgi:hypothetical protein